MRRVSARKVPRSGFRCGSQRRPSAHSSDHDTSASPLGMVGDQTRVAEAHVAEDHAASLGHPVHLALLDLQPRAAFDTCASTLEIISTP